nr:hypothetical protein [uncultured Rhodopila sp.]
MSDYFLLWLTVAKGVSMLAYSASFKRLWNTTPVCSLPVCTAIPSGNIGNNGILGTRRQRRSMRRTVCAAKQPSQSRCKTSPAAWSAVNGTRLPGQTDRALRLTERFAACSAGTRTAGLVEHKVETIQQGLTAVLAGDREKLQHEPTGP